MLKIILHQKGFVLSTCLSTIPSPLIIKNAFTTVPISLSFKKPLNSLQINYKYSTNDQFFQQSQLNEFKEIYDQENSNPHSISQGKKKQVKKLDLQTVRNSAMHLINYDSLVLDNFCQIFVSLFVNRHPRQLEQQYFKNIKDRLKPKTDIQNLDQYFHGYLDEYLSKLFPQHNFFATNQSQAKSVSGYQFIRKNQEEILLKLTNEVSRHRRQKKSNLLTLSPDESSIISLDEQDIKKEAKLVMKNVKNIFKFLDKASVGFLRGDLHSQTIFKINKYIERLQNNKKDNLKGANFSIEDYKRLFQQVTQFTNFRIPKRGILHYQLQSKQNLYQRQLTVQSVSSQQSFDKFHGAMSSLASVNKVHLTGVAKHYIIQWLPSVIESINDQQLRCKFKDLDEKRMMYAPFIIKINAEKIATIILSQLISQIMEVIFVGGETQCIQANQYYAIPFKKLSKKVSSVINSQFLFEQQQKKFRSIQKLYDYIMNYQLKKSSFQLEGISPEQLQKLTKLCQTEINLKDLEHFMTSLKIFDVEKALKNDNQVPQQGMVKKLQIKSFLQKRLEYRFVKPEERKQFLNQVINRITKRNGPRRLSPGQIPEHIQLQLGNILVNIMQITIKVLNRHKQKTNLLVEQKKLVKNLHQDHMKTVILLKINQDFLANIVPRLQKEGDLFLHQQRSVSTIVPPLPWVQPQVGGYYLQATNFMRFSQCKIQQRLVKYSDLKRFYGVLNYLGSIPWKINRKVLAIIQQVWSEGGEQGQIPKRYSQMVTKYMTKLKQQRNPKILGQIKRKIQALRDQHTEKCSFIFKLNTARAFAKIKYLYFPHNIDFRGRVYPVPPHLNHMGNDISRGLLLLGKGQKLGNSGLKWLKIHCANLMGKDKSTISQKLAFIQDNLDLIKAIANHPMQNRQWLKNQDCWQCLAAIFELNDALQSPNTAEFVSHLHIHQDGSCNGLQHYAALGRDMQGAYQVNLGVTDRPGDVYTYVAKMVIKQLEQASISQTDVNCELAKKLKDNIKRKTIKQTVMTSVYGVTFIGAREQIHRQLKDQNFLGDDECYKASIYVTSLTLKAISNLFTGAHHIKKWLIACAKLISDQNCPVGWITPLGLPVVQPYRSLSRLDAINTVSQLLKVPKDNQLLPVNKSKQKSAFPPNFVHSLDSTHMLFTAEQCNRRNLSFAAVHDSYWTHAGKVEEMNQILRDQFINLHSQPLLENLKVSFQRRFPQIQFPPIPQRGTFDLQNVRKSIFFFS